VIGRINRSAYAAGTKPQRFVPAVVLLRASAVLALSVISCRSSAVDFPIHTDGVAPDVSAAVQAAYDRVRSDSKSAANWLALGMVCEANGLSAEARAAYQRSVALDERQPRAWYRLALTQGRAGHLTDAMSAIERAIALDGGYAPAHWRRGLWLLDQAKEGEARSAFEKATAIDPANPGGWVGLARVAMAQQRPADAVDLLEKFLSQHPGDLYAIHLLGTAYQRLGRTDEAEYARAMAGPGEPVWPDAWSDELHALRVGFAQTLKEATAQQLSGNYGAAIPLFERLSKERPDDLSLMQQLGLSYVAAGRSADGLSLLRRALDRDPDNLETHLRLASAYLNTHDYAQALVHADRAVALSPELGRAHESRGMALWRGQRPVEAFAAFQSALRFDPANVQTHIWMGWILLEAGRAQEADPHFETAARRNPMLADAYVGMGIVSLQRGRLDDAGQAFERAAKLEPDNPRLVQARTQLEALRSKPGGRE
jgi:tetratricopeptide (TPR) repeat protein